MKKLPCPCGAKSVPGLIFSVSLCQKHYDGLMFAKIDSPEYLIAAGYFRSTLYRWSKQPRKST